MRSYDIAAYGQPLKLSERPTPKPVGAEVLVRVTAAGVCHSDVHIWEGYFDLGGGKKFRMEERGMKLPHTLGHETVGEVVALGPEASGVKVGSRYLVFPWIGCGHCDRCKAGEDNMCTRQASIGVVRHGSDPRDLSRSPASFSRIPRR